MRIEHAAIFTNRLEILKDFYVKYFSASADKKYMSENKLNPGFESYFLSFSSGARLELMTKEKLTNTLISDEHEMVGFSHIAFSVGSIADLDNLIQKMENDGIIIATSPHNTGDGYYEACILDPDGNRIEILVS